MTQREALNAVIAETQNADLAKWAVKELEKVDARNAKRAEQNSKKAAENLPLKRELFGLLTSEPATAATLGAATGVSTSKASSMLRQMVEDEEEFATVCVTDVKVPKKGKQKGYYVA